MDHLGFSGSLAHPSPPWRKGDGLVMSINGGMWGSLFIDSLTTFGAKFSTEFSLLSSLLPLDVDGPASGTGSGTGSVLTDGTGKTGNSLFLFSYSLYASLCCCIEKRGDI